MNTKITPQHQSKPAYIYIRQSTLAQVRHHQESTERQYALRDKALALGWPQTAIRILDRDLGQSGAQMTGREDFKTLVADVSMGNVGAVFALEVSRLARSNLDWHRLLELCALTHTLVIDADGCYDAGDFNDGLILGLKGTMAQAELHFLRGRLQGGKLNKAKKGELRFPLPVGLCYDDDGRIVLDPDDEVRGAVQLVFRLFQETGSAYAVVKRFAEECLWRCLGRPTHLGAPEPRTRTRADQESFLCGRLCLWTISVSSTHNCTRRDPEARTAGTQG